MSSKKCDQLKLEFRLGSVYRGRGAVELFLLEKGVRLCFNVLFKGC